MRMMLRTIAKIFRRLARRQTEGVKSSLRRRYVVTTGGAAIALLLVVTAIGSIGLARSMAQQQDAVLSDAARRSALLVDRAGCLDPFTSEMHTAMVDALGRLKPEDEVAVMAFAESVDLVDGFRSDRQMTTDAIDHLPHHEEMAGHCFSRALYSAADYMMKAANPNGRRVIIVITGGRNIAFVRLRAKR